MLTALQVGWTEDDQTIFDHLWGRTEPGSTPSISAPSILVWNKVDLAVPQAPAALHEEQGGEAADGVMSSVLGSKSASESDVSRTAQTLDAAETGEAR